MANRPSIVLPAQQLACAMSDYASVLNMTSGAAARCATWLLRVLDPHMEEYSFVSRGENINACHFHCVLVGDTPS